MTEQALITYIARMINCGRVIQVIDFEALNDDKAWIMANDGIDPLSGQWVEITRKPDPQGELSFY